MLGQNIHRQIICFLLDWIIRNGQLSTVWQACAPNPKPGLWLTPQLLLLTLSLDPCVSYLKSLYFPAKVSLNHWSVLQPMLLENCLGSGVSEKLLLFPKPQWAELEGHLSPGIGNPAHWTSPYPVEFLWGVSTTTLLQSLHSLRLLKCLKFFLIIICMEEMSVRPVWEETHYGWR